MCAGEDNALKILMCISRFLCEVCISSLGMCIIMLDVGVIAIML